jgi:hypothetical protein
MTYLIATASAHTSPWFDKLTTGVENDAMGLRRLPHPPPSS